VDGSDTRVPRRIAAVALLASFACLARDGAPPRGLVRGQEPGVPDAREAPGAKRVFEDWSTIGHFAFEEAVAAWAPGPEPLRLGEEDLRALAQALDRQDESSVRAAVLLARSRAEEAEELLLVRLEKRRKAPSRELDAGDLVAAAALAATRSEGRARRLEALATGATPHPDLEVRVECACSALRLGRDGVIPFLLRALRAMTHDEKLAPPDWEPTQTMAWAKTRAAEALSERAGIQSGFRPDGSVAHQEEEARRLEELLGDR